MESLEKFDQKAPATRWRVLPKSDASERCPVRDVLDRVGDAWSVLVLLVLRDGPTRFNALRRSIGDISQRMLTVTLRHLERDGFVSRTVFPTNPPQVEYGLTELGRSLAKQIDGLTVWATESHERVREARKAFDAGQRN